MNSEDKKIYIQRYKDRYHHYGYSPATLGWGKGGRQDIRFDVLYGIGIKDEASVLDVGCGFADLWAFLTNRGWHGKYLGVDIVEELLKEAKIQHPAIEVQLMDILNEPIQGHFDYVLSSGIFNARLTDEDNYQYIESMLKCMYNIAGEAVAADFMTTYVDYEHELAFHAQPERIFTIARSISNRVVLRHDYMPYEFCIYLYKNGIINKKDSLFC